MQAIEQKVERLAETRVLTLGHVGAGTGDHEPFDQLYPNSMLVDAEAIRNGCDIDALVIWGGEDISPSLYGAKKSKATWANVVPSHRDVLERDACLAAIARDIPIIGVCRGAQLVCALAGGSLIQHVNRHGGTHQMETKDGEILPTSSVHHQMQYPFDIEHEMIAWAHPSRSDIYTTGDHDNDPKMEGRVEPEIVWYPTIKALGIQGHPEFHSNPRRDPFVQYCMSLVNQYILGNK